MSPRLASASLCLAMVMALTASGCGGFRPYRKMAQAATSEESPFAQAGDDKLKLAVREALVANGLGLSVSPYVYMDHAFLVGNVNSVTQRDLAINTASGVAG